MRLYRSSICGYLIAILAGVLAASGRDSFLVLLRSRVEAFKGTGQWQEITFNAPLVSKETAVVICDMWDKHWCRGANARVGTLVKRMEPVVRKMRERGMLIIHAPSDTMGFYKDAPQRKMILAIPRMTPPAALSLSDPPLPVDASDGGCDTPGDTTYRAWTRQHAGLTVAPEDLISDNGEEIFSALRARGVGTLLIMGVHTNMCVLTRSFAIRQMTKWGVRCILVRDLTDAMYDPADKPYVSHETGTEMVVQHIEKYWAPTTTSEDLLKAIGKR